MEGRIWRVKRANIWNDKDASTQWNDKDASTQLYGGRTRSLQDKVGSKQLMNNLIIYIPLLQKRILKA